MNKKYYQLIGFVTLILLALLLAPYVLTNKSEQVEPAVQILSSPSGLEPIDGISELDIGETTAESTTEPSVSDQKVVTLPDTSSTHVQENTNTRSQAEKSYVIQLVALKNKQKIEELIALLRLNNYDVYTVPPAAQEGQVTRLFVGYYPTKEQAEMVIIDLEHLTKLKGFISTN